MAQDAFIGSQANNSSTAQTGLTNNNGLAAQTGLANTNGGWSLPRAGRLRRRRHQPAPALTRFRSETTKTNDNAPIAMDEGVAQGGDTTKTPPPMAPTA